MTQSDDWSKKGTSTDYPSQIPTNRGLGVREKRKKGNFVVRATLFSSLLSKRPPIHSYVRLSPVHTSPTFNPFLSTHPLPLKVLCPSVATWWPPFTETVPLQDARLRPKPNLHATGTYYESYPKMYFHHRWLKPYGTHLVKTSVCISCREVNHRALIALFKNELSIFLSCRRLALIQD